METKEMFVADLNIVFGKDEPLLRRMNDIVLPAMQSDLYRESGKRNTKMFF